MYNIYIDSSSEGRYPRRDWKYDGILLDFCDGAFVKKITTTSEPTLHLAFYHDDVEVANPLGSRRGTHKLGEELIKSLLTINTQNCIVKQ